MPAASEPAAAKPAGGAASPAPAIAVATIRDIKRMPLPDGVRVSIELDSESRYRYERLDNPRRVFFDLKGTRAPASLQDAVLKFDDDIVREIRLGRHPNNTTRVVMDMERIETCNVFTLYNPFRLVVDFKREATVTRPSRSGAIFYLRAWFRRPGHGRLSLEIDHQPERVVEREHAAGLDLLHVHHHARGVVRMPSQAESRAPRRLRT